MDRYEEKDTICICEKEDLLAGLHEYKIHLSAGVSLTMIISRKSVTVHS